MNRSGFTLIELMMVIAILSILSVMAMPVLSVAQRLAKRSATEAVMRKCDTALRLFRLETGTYPYQADYADLDNGEQPTNRLYFHLGTTLTPADFLKLKTDIDTAAAQYTYDCTPAGGSGDAEEPTAAPRLGPHAFVSTDVKPGVAWAFNNHSNTWILPSSVTGSRARMATAAILNRMARERARRAILAGHTAITGCSMTDALRPDGNVYITGRDLSATPLLTNPASSAQPGWGADYLYGELEARYIDGDTVLDAYRRPLVYVGQVIEGMRSSGGFLFDAAAVPIDSREYGLARSGRRSLALIDPFTGEPLQADGAALPDPTRRMHSDRRSYAAPGHETTFELWSMGASGRMGWMRDDPRNGDNIPLLPYDKGL